MAFTGYSNEGLAMLGQGIDSIGTAINDYRTRQDVQQALSILGQAQAGGMPQLGAPAGGTVQVGPLTPLGKQSDAAPIDLKSIPTFVQAAGQGTGIDPSYIARTFQVESGGNPNAVSPTGAKGLGQFTSGTWKTYGAGLGSPFDPNASAMATANLTADNADGLAQALGREPTQGETYLAHQQGLGGARALLSNPNANVVDALAAAYGGDRNKAARAVMVNGGRPDMTAGDFAAKWVSKFPATPVRVGLGDAEVGAPAAGQAMTMPASAIAAPAGPDAGPAPVASGGIDPGVRFSLVNGAKANPNSPATSYTGPAVVAANRDLFINPQTGQPRTAAEAAALLEGGGAAPASRGVQVASNDPSFVPPSAAAMSPSQVLVNQAQARAAAQQGGGNDPLVVVPGINGGRPINKAWVAAAPDGTDVPDDGVLEAAQARALGGGAGTQVVAGGSVTAPMDLSAAARGAPAQAAAKPDDSFVPGSVASPALSAGRQLLTSPIQFPQSKAAQLPPDLAARLLTNPRTANVAQAIISAQYGGKGGAWQISKLENGQNVLFNPNVGMIPLAAATPDKFSHFKGPDGNEYSWNEGTAQLNRLIDGGPDEGTYTNINGHLVFGTKTGDTKDVTPAGLPQGARPATAEEKAAYSMSPTAPLAIGGDGKPFLVGAGANGMATRPHVIGNRLVANDGSVVYEGPAPDSMDQDTINSLADRVVKGDTSALVGLGRGAQGAANLAKIQGRVAQIMKDNNQDPTDILHNRAVAQGMGAAERTGMTQEAKMGAAGFEANNMIDLALNQSNLVPRTSFVPVNRAIQAWQQNTGDPNIRAFGATVNSLVNAYSRAINPNGVGTVSDKEHAREMLSTADSPEAFKAVTDIMRQEIEAAHKSPGQASQYREQQRQLRKTQTVPNQVGASQEAPAPAGTPKPPPAAPPDLSAARKAADGNYYLPDPARPGKYLRVDP